MLSKKIKATKLNGVDTPVDVTLEIYSVKMDFMTQSVEVNYGLLLAGEARYAIGGGIKTYPLDLIPTLDNLTELLLQIGESLVDAA